MRYNDITRRYFAQAPRAGRLESAQRLHGERGERSKGLWVAFDFLVDDRRIVDAAFLALGCPHTIAVAAFLTELAVGLPLAAKPPRNLQSLRALFEVPTEKLGRLLLIEDAWAAAAREGPLTQL